MQDVMVHAPLWITPGSSGEGSFGSFEGVEAMLNDEVYRILIAKGYYHIDDDRDGPRAFQRDVNLDLILQVKHCAWLEGKDLFGMTCWTVDGNHDWITVSIEQIIPGHLATRLEQYEDRVCQMVRLALGTAEYVPRGGTGDR